MGLKRLNDRVNDFERGRPVLFATGIGVFLAVLVVAVGWSWYWGLAYGAFVVVLRLVIRPRVVARRSVLR